MYDSATHAERRGWSREGDELVVCDCKTDMTRTADGWECDVCGKIINETGGLKWIKK